MGVYWTDGDVSVNCSQQSSRRVLIRPACPKVGKECDGTDDRVGIIINDSEREAKLPDDWGSGREAVECIKGVCYISMIARDAEQVRIVA